MALGSKNNFFNQSNKALLLKREQVITFLMIKRFSLEQTKVVLLAYDYMCFNPSKFDGSTASEDLYDIPADGSFNGLEIGSLVHDWLYVIGAYYSKKSLRLTDSLLKKISKKTNKSSWEYELRNIKLWLLREILNYAYWQRKSHNASINPEILKKIVQYYNIFNLT